MARSVVSLIRNLQRRNARRRQPLAVLEGVRLCEEALAAHVPFVGVVVSPTLLASGRGETLVSALRAESVTIESASDETVCQIADTESPQGIVAVVEPRVWSLTDVDVRRSHPVVILDRLQDPGNVGTIMRTAFSLGASGVLCLPETVRLTHPKLLRSSLGATLRFPVAAIEIQPLLAWAADRDVTLWAATSDGDDVRGIEIPDRVGIVVGNEGAGVRAELIATAARRVAVRMRAEAESINAAAAAAILLYEATR